MNNQEQDLAAIRQELVAVKRDLIDMGAMQTAIIEYLCALAELTQGVPQAEAKAALIQGFQRHRSACFEVLEERNPLLAAMLDDRSVQDVEDGLSRS